MSVETWKRLRSEPVADCRVFTVRRDYCKNNDTGKEAQFFVIENPDWVNVIPVTADGEIVLISQYRYGTESITLEIPGGMVDEGEEPENAARRELLEETGYECSKVILLGRSNPNPALQNNWVYHFAAIGCENTGSLNLDEHESIETRVVKKESIVELIKNEEITHSLVLAAFQRFEAFRDESGGCL